MPKTYLALGSNLGDKEENINRALALLQSFGVVTRSSSWWRTEPVGEVAGDWFLNGAIEFETDLSPRELLLACQQIEKQLGRVRTVKNGPRTIDLDILFFDDLVREEDDLVIPHPRLSERRFVLVPLCEIAPEMKHPALKKTAKELLADLGDTVMK